MADIHIEEFYKDLAKILLHLHSVFPRRSQVFVEDISGIDQPDEYGLHSPRHQSCFSAMLWLADEGFIRFQDTIRQEAIDQAVLTQKAFVRLNRLTGWPSQFTELQSSSPTPVGGNDQTKGYGSIHYPSSEPLTNVQLIRNTMRTATSTRLAQVLEDILFGGE